MTNMDGFDTVGETIVDTPVPENPGARSATGRTISEAARRALAEAEARRRTQLNHLSAETELSGRGGLEPVRYGDWEIKGLTTDF